MVKEPNVIDTITILRGLKNVLKFIMELTLKIKH